MAAMDAASATEVAEQKLAQAEEAVKRGEPGAETRLQLAEEELEAALDATVNAEFDEEWGEGEEEDDEEEEGVEGGFTKAMLFPASEKAREGKAAEKEEDETEEEQRDGKFNRKVQPGQQKCGEDSSGTGTPPNFSQVDLSSLSESQNLCGKWSEKLLSQFPSLASAKCFEVRVHAGDMLYLPAGWFHEVTSMSSRMSASSPGAESVGHMALNYWCVKKHRIYISRDTARVSMHALNRPHTSISAAWSHIRAYLCVLRICLLLVCRFHPPDGKDSSTFEKPYSQDFWPRDWAMREHSTTQ